MANRRDTIYALSSGRGIAAVAVIRISGPRADEALHILTGKLPPPRKAALVTIRSPEREPIDQALALWFPGPHSETGEDVAELQIHGGRAVIAAVLARLSGIKGLRLAEAGEFTRRAFENGKLDLTRVEGLADLIMAETEGQRRQAFAQLKGLLGGRADTWRGRLVAALALVEVRIDFSDEADVPADLLAPALRIARELEAEIAGALADGGRGERLRDGFVVAIAGPPNAGKSTLLNRLARREAAIVSPFPGTTRDVVEVHLDLDGCPVTLLDTAGIRPTDDPVEREGVKRARERAAAADLVLWIDDLSRFEAGELADAQVADGSLAELPVGDAKIWRIGNKADLQVKDELGFGGNESQSIVSVVPGNEALTKNFNASLTECSRPKNESRPTGAEPEFISSEIRFRISATTGDGIDALMTALAAAAADFLATGEPALITRERHRHALRDAREALQRAIAEPAASREDLLAEELRLSARALGRLTGRIDVEDVLDVIFRDFCIGK